MPFKKKYLTAVLAATFLSSNAAQADTKGYEVIELETVPFALSSTVYDMNAAGDYVGIGYDIVDIPLRVDLINPNLLQGIKDINNLTGPEYQLIRDFLNSRNDGLANPERQKLTRYSAFVHKGNFKALNNDFDVVDGATGVLTRSNDLQLFSINDAGYSVGQFNPPFLQTEGYNINEEPVLYFVRDSLPFAVWTDGVQMTELKGVTGVTYTGSSRAVAINNNNEVVGFASVSDTQEIKNIYQDCNDAESTLAHLPVNACIHRSWASAEFGQPRRAIYNEEAYYWKLDQSGNVIEQKSLGTAPTLLDENENLEEEQQLSGNVRSEALAINDQGVAVGFTQLETGQFILNYATVFAEGEAKWVLSEDTLGYTQSKATLINDEGYIIGYAAQRGLQYTRERLFVGHLDGRDVQFPRGFFTDSAWRAKSINNHNKVVGQAERDRTQISNRRTVAFLYDLETDKITDLNALIPCDANYSLFDAVSINDQGDIIALADQVETKTIDGREFKGTYVRPVLLRESSQVQSCGDDFNKQERRGASITPIDSIGMFVLSLFALGLRVRSRKKTT